MKYQLVLQFPCHTIEDYDALIEFEDKLIDSVALRGMVNVDGHDSGSSEMNLFLHTNDPAESFRKIMAHVESPLLNEMKAGFRELNQEADYQPIWPEQLTEFTIK